MLASYNIKIGTVNTTDLLRDLSHAVSLLIASIFYSSGDRGYLAMFYTSSRENSGLQVNLTWCYTKCFTEYV